MRQEALNKINIYSIPTGRYFGVEDSDCQLVYAPLANVFFLATQKEVERLEYMAKNNYEEDKILKMMKTSVYEDLESDISEDTFCTLHLLLNEKCNLKCKYCYSAAGRSDVELTMGIIEPMLNFFLSEKRKAVKDRTIMFMGGGEPTLSWNLLKNATLYAKEITAKSKVKPHFAVTTNGSLINEEMISFFREHDFTVQVSFEILPDVQNEQRGLNDTVASNVERLTKAGVKNYIRSTITEKNVDRIPEMVEYCHNKFPLISKLSCQQVVDPYYFSSTDIVKVFFDKYYNSFKEGERIAVKYGITLSSSSSHLINYSKRERFCYNLVCLTPYGTLTVCPDVSSPADRDYEKAVFGKISDDGTVSFELEKFHKITNNSIYTIDKCKDCYAKWNCGSGCPSNRRVYAPEIFDAICNHYRRMLTDSLIRTLESRHKEASGRDLYKDINLKLKRV